MLRKLFPAVMLAVCSVNTIANNEIYIGGLGGHGLLTNKLGTPSSAWYGGISVQEKLRTKEIMASHLQIYVPSKVSVQTESSEDGKNGVLEYGIEKNFSFLWDGVYKKLISVPFKNFKGYVGLGPWGSISLIGFDLARNKDALPQNNPNLDIKHKNKRQDSWWDLAAVGYGITLTGGVQRYNLTSNLLIDFSVSTLLSFSNKVHHTPLSIRLCVGYRMS